MSKRKKILIVFFCTIYTFVSAQEKQNKIPKKAGSYSAIIPGAGQIYTKKYWKVPIIYAGLITSAYYIKQSNDSYQLYKDTYLKRINGEYSDEFQGKYSDANLITLSNHYRRNREISILFFIGTYILNIVDASVNAHLFQYEIDENISLKIDPFSYDQFNHNLISLKINI